MRSPRTDFSRTLPCGSGAGEAKVIASLDIECGICGKIVQTRGKFGLLNCHHPFCLTCIRSWRAKNVVSGMDVLTVRACPICGDLTNFITPSVVWIIDPLEKADIINSYLSKIRFMSDTAIHF